MLLFQDMDTMVESYVNAGKVFAKEINGINAVLRGVGFSLVQKRNPRHSDPTAFAHTPLNFQGGTIAYKRPEIAGKTLEHSPQRMFTAKGLQSGTQVIREDGIERSFVRFRVEGRS